jgi:hypothetical protein
LSRRLVSFVRACRDVRFVRKIIAGVEEFVGFVL